MGAPPSPLGPPTERASPLLLASVALISGSALGLEILWMRLLSIAWWHHFAYMVISLALLGYGASGTFLTLVRRALLSRFRGAYAASAALFGLGAPLSFALARRVPFNPLEVVWNPGELFGLAAVYLLLAVPFFCAGTAVGLALARHTEGAGRVYAADLLGAGVGAAAIVGVLFVLPPAEGLVAVGVAGFVSAALAVVPARGRSAGRARLVPGALLLLAGAALALFWPRSWAQPEVSQYKGLAGALRVPGVSVVAERSSPLGLLTVVESERVPLRHAPGLSLTSATPVPEQLGVFTDGDALSVIDRLAGEGLDAVAYRDAMTSALPYHVLERQRPGVLVLGAGGGGEVTSALWHGARRVDAVELNPQVVGLVADDFADFAGGLYGRPDVAVHRAEARGFAAGSEGSWDLIQVALVDSFTASAAGTHALSESHLYTVEAVGDFLDRLEPGGILAFTRSLQAPPRGGVKLLATAVAGLEARGVAEPGGRLLAIRGWDTVTLLVKAGADFTGPELAAARRFAEERWFDLAWAPGMRPEEANVYNVQEAPYLHDAARAILAGGATRSRFFDRYKFHVEPATDDRPYFFRFFKWRVLPELLALRGRGGTHLLEWSYPLLVATLAQAVLAGLVLILAPLALARSGLRGAQGGRREARGLGRVALFFLCLGLAFLAVEIAFIQRFTLFLSHPLYAVAVVLAGFLVFAGAGSAGSARLARRAPRSAIPLAVAAVVVLALAYTLLLPPLFARAAGLPQAAKVAVALALLAPLAFAMGMPFPLGLERTGRREPAWVPWAWAVNGCASVVSAVAATLAAVHFGFSAVVLAAAGLYALAAWAIRGL